MSAFISYLALVMYACGLFILFAAVYALVPALFRWVWNTLVNPVVAITHSDAPFILQDGIGRIAGYTARASVKVRRFQILDRDWQLVYKIDNGSVITFWHGNWTRV